MAGVDFERKHAEDLQRLRGFRLLDDDFMSKVFEDKACSEFLLKIVLDKKDLNVQKVRVQYDVKNLQGRSIRLDIVATDENGWMYNIEIQRSDKGASIKRARYNSSLLDANVTEPGDDYENLAETYVIFITENDVLKAGLPIYHIDRTIKETGAMFGDEAHILYVNSQIKDETELGKLMHDFSCTDAKDMHYKILADRVRYFKEDAKGVETMCKAMEDMRKEAAAEQNILTLLGAIKNLMKNLGMSAEQAMTALGVSDAERGVLSKKI
ncbi:PD-(D/E)XK nuclease family transposase [bacterium 210820-DFI.6.37]|nr:PD-(D/E)XK nuclease family transposase [bacterium 210820-DFI.6.37]